MASRVDVCRNARAWSRRFERGGGGRVDIDARGSCVPRIGKLVAIEWDERTRRARSVTYERRVQGRGYELRKHTFEEDAAPLVSRTRGGKLRVSGGRYTVSSERGIVDMAKKKRAGKRKAKKNVFRRASPDKTWKFVETAGIVGVGGVTATMLTRILLDRYTDWAPNTKAWLRAGGLVGAGLLFMNDAPRLAAAMAAAGLWIGGEKLLDTLEVERRLIQVLPARPTTTSTTGGGTTGGTTGGSTTGGTTGGARGLNDGRQRTQVYNPGPRERVA